MKLILNLNPDQSAVRDILKNVTIYSSFVKTFKEVSLDVWEIGLYQTTTVKDIEDFIAKHKNDVDSWKIVADG